MNRITLVCALVVFAICSPACAQKNGTSSVASSKNSSATSTSKPAGKVVESSAPVETQAEANSTEEAKDAGKPAKSTTRNALTAEQEKKIKSLMKQTLKSFAKAELTEDQLKQAEELFSKTAKDCVVKRNKADINDELEKKRSEGLKEARTAGKSVKEQADAAFVFAGFTEEQIKVYKSTQAALIKAKREFGKTLTEDQITKLPKPLQVVISTK